MTKDTIIAILKNETAYLSGEKISSMLGISRTAVNSAIKSLRQDGYEILSSTNKGYLLSHAPDSLKTGDLLALLPRERMELIKCLDTVDSTNNKLRELAQKGAPEGQVVVANEQTAGLGRFGRSFESPRDKGIYISMLLRPEGIPDETTALTAWTAVAVSNAVETVCGLRPGIKWVNDLILNHKKICGILTEMTIDSESRHIQYIIVGIGLNVNEQNCDFSPELKNTAASLLSETGRSFKRALLAAEIIKEMDQVRCNYPEKKQSYLAAYRAGSITTGHKIEILSGKTKRSGFANAIHDDFSLSVTLSDGATEFIKSGEVSVCGVYGFHT